MTWTWVSPQAKPIPSRLTGGTGGDHSDCGPIMCQFARSGAWDWIRTLSPEADREARLVAHLDVADEPDDREAVGHVAHREHVAPAEAPGRDEVRHARTYRRVWKPMYITKHTGRIRISQSYQIMGGGGLVG